MSSSSSSSAPSAPAPTRHKRKREAEDANDSYSNDLDNDQDSSSGSESENEEGPVTPAAQEDEDAPVLSHAAKRKQKKKEEKLQRQQETGATDSAAPKKKRKLKDGSITSSKDATNEKTIKRQNSVWVGNMSFKTTEENLRAFFKDRGVGEVTRVNMPTKATGKGPVKENRGFAYVDFETPEAKQAAIALSEQPLVGRKLLIKDGDDFTGRPNQPTVEVTTTVNGVKKSLSKTAQKILKNQKQPPAPTLFFGNLSFDTTEDSIRELLEAHREKPKQKGKSKEEGLCEGEKKDEPWIRKIRMGTFEDSGKCKGFAFVDFSSTESATTALVTPKNHHLNGRDLVVEYASAEAVRRGAVKGPKQKTQGDTIYTPSERTEKRPRPKKDLSPHKAEFRRYEEEHAMEVETTNDDTNPRMFGRTSRTEGHQKDRGDRDKGRTRARPKPGAALALAKRESAAIVPSQGQKITF